MNNRNPRGFPSHATGTHEVLSRFVCSVAGSGTWHKPLGCDPDDTVLMRVRGGGGGGDATPGAGGGGGFNQRAYRAGDVPASVSWVNGAGGPNNTAGGDSYISGTGVDVAATGGKASAGSYAGGKPAFRYGTSTCYEFDFAPYNGGTGGAPGSLVLASAIWGGAAGVATVTATGPKSIHSGNGSGNDGAAITPAVPGGGGTTYVGAGQAADGSIEILVLRGRHYDVMSDCW